MSTESGDLSPKTWEMLKNPMFSFKTILMALLVYMSMWNSIAKFRDFEISPLICMYDDKRQRGIRRRHSYETNSNGFKRASYFDLSVFPTTFDLPTRDPVILCKATTTYTTRINSSRRVSTRDFQQVEIGLLLWSSTRTEDGLMLVFAHTTTTTYTD